MKRTFMVIAATCAAGSLALTNCTADGTPTALTIYSSKPQNPLLPAQTSDVGGAFVLDAVFRGLVRYNPDTAAPELSMAESIMSSDNTTWTIRLKARQTFQDGSPVTAASFVDAWNWAAYGPNGTQANYYFAQIKGYDALNPADPDGSGPREAPMPSVQTLSGLRVDSPTVFTVTLSTPQSSFAMAIGYNAFYPLPEVFYRDVEAFGKKPVGNGPFKIVAGDRNSGFTMQKWSGYQGPDQPKVARVTFKTYASDTAAYADLLAGNLDFMHQVSAAALVDDQYQRDLPRRFSHTPIGKIYLLTLPQYSSDFANDPDIGKAISLAIDRETITRTVFNGARTPATGWVSPIVQGYKAGACGEFCTFNPDLARQYLARSGFKGTFSYSYPADDPGNREAAEAICNSIKNALARACRAKPYVDYATMADDLNEKKMTSLFHRYWLMDYPSIANFLEPLYVTGASSNFGDFSDPQFDAMIRTANSQEDAAALLTYQRAEALLSQRMTVVPLWYAAQQSGWSKRLSNVTVTPFSTLDLSRVTIK